MLFCFNSQESQKSCISHVAPMLCTGTASWPSGGCILLSFARKAFNSLFNKIFSKLRMT